MAHLYELMEQHLITSMQKNLMRHRREEAKLGEDYTQWQSAKLRELRRFRKENKAIIGGATKHLPKDIQQHLLNEYRQGLVGVIKKHKEKFGDTTLTRDLSDGFFGTNDKKIQALIDVVNNDLQAANHAALRKANDAYRQTIHKAAMFAANGVTTEKQAIEMAIHEFAKRGLNCIKYSNGARHNIKEYAEMALRTAETRAMLMGEGKARQELGETLVQITKHGTACPLCVPFEGKVLIDDVYSGGTWENSKEAYEKVPRAKRAGVRFMSEAMKQGLYHPRCRHGLGTFYIELLDDEPKRIEYPASKHTEKTIAESGKGGKIKADKVIAGHSGTPKIAIPLMIIDHLNDDGIVDARAFYGNDGMKEKDLHTNDHGNPKWHDYGEHGEHAHDYEWDEAGSLKNKTTRDWNDEEKERNGDIL